MLSDNSIQTTDVDLIAKSSNIEEYKTKVQDDYDKALAAFLNEQTPADAIYKRQGRGNMTFDYVQGSWVIKQLNILFNRRWSWCIGREEVGESQVWVRGVLEVRVGPGEEGLIRKEAYGGADIKRFGGGNSRGGQVIDLADDLKSASTDALKKAASLLGIAGDVYGGYTDSGSAAPAFDKTRLRVLYSRGKNLGMDEEKLGTWVEEKYSKTMEDMSEPELNKVLGDLVKLDTEQQKVK